MDSLRSPFSTLLIGTAAVLGFVACDNNDIKARSTLDGGDDGTSHGGDATETNSCANLDLLLERQPTTIMLVIDHSASMALQLGDNDTRWSVMVKALMGTTDNPQEGLIWLLEESVYFGIVLFTAKRNEPSTCPILDTVGPALNNGSAIASILKADDETYQGASPVPEGIAVATDMLTAMETTSDKFILLATDGLPQTCDTLAENDSGMGEAATIEAVQAAYSAGIPTFVVGVGDEVTATHLQQIANAGAGLDPYGTEKAVFYRGATENSLIDGISTIINKEPISCIYELDGKGVSEGEVTKGKVLLDGVKLELANEENGWRMKSANQIELLGEACEKIQVGDHHLKAEFPCETLYPPH